MHTIGPQTISHKYAVSARKDRLTKRQRSRLMSKIRARDTKPERAVRRILRDLGFTYRLHRADLPGTPDIVIAKHRIAIFVHGCFWHGHKCVAGRNIPATNRQYWLPKLKRNRQRDAENLATLKAVGWKTIVTWECETRNSRKLTSKLTRLLATRRPRTSSV